MVHPPMSFRDPPKKTTIDRLVSFWMLMALGSAPLLLVGLYLMKLDVPGAWIVVALVGLVGLSFPTAMAVGLAFAGFRYLTAKRR